MNSWQELTIHVHRDAEEAVSNLMIETGSQGVAMSDSADYVGQEDRFGELYPEVEQSDMIAITAYYPDTVDIEEVKADLATHLADLTGFGLEIGQVSLESQELAEEDWADNWKKYYEPARITHDLTIVPSWTDYEATAGEKIIRLDPGMAFGTGTHPTTKMSLFALSQVLRGGETVIDVGTGSGVLSIASSLLGAKEILPMTWMKWRCVWLRKILTSMPTPATSMSRQATCFVALTLKQKSSLPTSWRIFSSI